MDIKNLLKEYEKVSLSNYDIFKLLDKKARILTYPELVKYDDIEKVLYPNNCFVLLYLTKPNYGHWCCVIKHNDRIEFFDPYGDSLPDDQFIKIPIHFREISKQIYPHLTYLLYKSPLETEYNNYPFQQLKNDISTCGRHCVIRILSKKLLLDDYYDFINYYCNLYNINPDQLVTLLTLYDDQSNN
jgi:hypothetical protein